MSADSRAEAARRAQLLRYTQLQRRQRELIIRALEDAKAEILKTMQGAPSDWQRYRLRAIEQSIDASMTRFRNRQIGAWTEGVTSAWALGQALVDAPLGAVGIATNFNQLDDRMLLSMRTWLTNKISDITANQRSAITAQLQLAATGAQSSQAAINGIAQIFNGDRQRAITITRTEIGRAHAAATWLRLKQAAERDPDLKKQWRRSGKLNSRHTHDMADGQVQEVNEFFRVGGEGLMYPRDPTASAKNTINCGCAILPYKKSWAVATPGPRPFTPQEIARRPLIADASTLVQGKISAALDGMQSAVIARFGSALGGELLDGPFVSALRASSAPQFFDPTFANARGAGLSPEESAALADWTIRGQALNRELIEGAASESIIYHLRRAIQALPPPSAPLRRWIQRRLTDEELNQFELGGVFTTTRFTAASLEGGVFIKPGTRPFVTFEILPKPGSDGGVVDAISWKPSEREVLFPPGTRFAVLDYRYSKSRYFITLQEL